MKPKNGLHWIIKYHLKFPLKTFYTYFTAILEVVLFTFPIRISARVINQVIEGGGFTIEIRQDIFFLLGLAFIQAIIFFSISFINEILAHRITTDMTQEFFETLQYRSLTYHDKQDVGNIMAIATGDTRTINIALSPATRFVFSVISVWVLNLINAFRVHWSLGIIGVVICILFYYSSIIYAKKLAPYASNTRQQFSNVSQMTSSSLEGIREIKGFRSELWAKRRFIKTSNALQDAEIREGKKAAWFYPHLFVTLYTASVIALSLFFASQSNPVLPTVNLEQIMVISGYILMLTGICGEFDWAMSFIVRAKAAADRLYNIIYDSDLGEFQEGEKSLDTTSTDLEFRNVSFKYSPHEPFVLKDISFKIRENQTVAIVGGPGSGKSTLTKLIQRLYLPTEGEILIGNTSITDFTNQSLRKAISTVEQDIFLFNLPVKDNIRFGKPEASDKMVIDAAKLAEAHEFIMEMPEQYDTLIGERGVRLSGGQAQRISIARALLINPKILIMDDAAAALDAKTEIKIQKAITTILKTRTTIITTHRLAIISKADKVIILDKGKIVGMGSHEELIRRNHFYRRLFEQHYELPSLEAAHEELLEQGGRIF
ncbi:MAG: ABC transporter ATP-binding protein [Candidatus Lokiarchaeota archaeon]|nr:ABC transporter ATP-binding protein [Candidatus Lokiarchaeota archaeon]